MRPPAVRLLALIFATALAVPALVGCDTETHKADKAIQAKLDQAVAERQVGTSESVTKARQILDAVASETGGSSGTRAQLAASRAQLQVDAALELIRNIDREELRLARTAFNLGQLAVQLDAGSVMVTGYGKYDPKAALDQIKQHVALAQGADDKPTWEHQGVQMPTIAAVKQKISELEGNLAKLQEEAKSLADQREATAAQAEAAASAADAASGQESVDRFKEASEFRKKAGETFIQIEKLNAEMIPVQRDLDLQRGQLQILEDIVKQLQAQAQALETGWNAIMQQIDQQNALAKRIVGTSGDSVSTATPSTGPASEGATVAEKAAQINQRAVEIRAMRQQALANLDDAAKLFDDAYKDADKMRQDLHRRVNEAGGGKDRADVQAWQAMIAIIDPQSYQLREGATRRTIGSMYTSEAASLMSRVNLQASVSPIIQRAGATVPAELMPGKLSTEAETAIKLGDEAYTAAESTLSTILDGTADKPTKDAARVERILNFYGWAQIDRLGGKSTAAHDHLQQAISQRNNAVEESVKLPALPAELGTPPARSAGTEGAPATAPSTAPATPTTEPAGGDAAEPATQPG